MALFPVSGIHFRIWWRRGIRTWYDYKHLQTYSGEGAAIQGATSKFKSYSKTTNWWLRNFSSVDVSFVDCPRQEAAITT